MHAWIFIFAAMQYY